VNPTSDSTTGPYHVEQIRTYCRVDVTPELAETEWERLEEATSAAVAAIKSARRSHVLVDLSDLRTIGSGTVASLVRIWKSLNKKSRRFVVVSQSDRVRKELESAGLQKLWTIVTNREEAAYELGVSRRAEREERELRILALGAFPCAVLAVLATVMMMTFRDSKEVIQVNAELGALLLGAVSLTVGIVSVLKDSGFRRLLSALAIVISLFVLGTLFFEENQIDYRFWAAPSREIESE
jgi:anti-anti-sigma factor